MDWNAVFFVSYGVLWVVVLLQVALILALARLVGQLMSRRFPTSGARVIDPGPDIGMTVESWEGSDLAGNPVSLQFPRQRALFLLYVAPHCTACARLLPSARHFFKEIASAADSVWVMTQGVTPEALRAYAQRKAWRPTPVCPKRPCRRAGAWEAPLRPLGRGRRQGEGQGHGRSP